jgi:hypothetical protein
MPFCLYITGSPFDVGITGAARDNLAERFEDCLPAFQEERK